MMLMQYWDKWRIFVKLYAVVNGKVYNNVYYNISYQYVEKFYNFCVLFIQVCRNQLLLMILHIMIDYLRETKQSDWPRHCAYQCISQNIIAYECIMHCAYHFMQLHINAYHWVSLHISEHHCITLHVCIIAISVYQWLSLHFIACMPLHTIARFIAYLCMTINVSAYRSCVVI